MSGITETGAAADVQTDEDFEYVNANIIQGDKPLPRQLRATARAVKLPVLEIERALTPGAYSTEPGDPQHIRERLQDRRDCPMPGCHYQHWNLELLRSHIVQHDEVKAYQRDVRRSAETYDILQKRRDRLRTQLSVLRQEYAQVEDSISRFDLSEHTERQRVAARLLKLLSQ